MHHKFMLELSWFCEGLDKARNHCTHPNLDEAAWMHYISDVRFLDVHNFQVTRSWWSPYTCIYMSTLEPLHRLTSIRPEFDILSLTHVPPGLITARIRHQDVCVLRYSLGRG